MRPITKDDCVREFSSEKHGISKPQLDQLWVELKMWCKNRNVRGDGCRSAKDYYISEDIKDQVSPLGRNTTMLKSQHP